MAGRQPDTRRGRALCPAAHHDKSSRCRIGRFRLSFRPTMRRRTSSATLENVTTALEPLAIPHEILVIDDGSTRRHGGAGHVEPAPVSCRQAAVNERNMGFGWSYRRGVDAAALDAHRDGARRQRVGLRDAPRVLQPRRRGGRDHRLHAGHVESRTWTRTLISKAFTLLVNLITRRRLRYYNGLQIHPAPVLKSLRIQSSGYGFQSEVLVKSLRRTKTVRRSADGPDRAREGREQGVPPARTSSTCCARSSAVRRARVGRAMS